MVCQFLYSVTTEKVSSQFPVGRVGKIKGRREVGNYVFPPNFFF